ncbi:HAD family phosphatase [bacterium]|nr:HAD family phosphatase [bacterium]
MIKTIFFDLGNVLIHVDKERAIWEIAKLPGLNLNTVKQIAESNLEKEFEKGYFSADEYIDKLQREYGILINVTLDHLIDIWQQPFEIIPEVWELIPVLKKQARLVLLSNTNDLHIRAVRKKYSILDELDNLVLSYEVGSCKPEEQIYREALKIEDSLPEESIFIDDLHENVVAARLIGIRSHQFQHVEGLRTFLQESGFSLI